MVTHNPVLIESAIGRPELGRRLLRSLYRAALRLRLRLWRGGYNRLRVERVHGVSIIVLPNVFNGVLLRTGAFLATTLDATHVPANARVLDLGAGSGINAIFAARLGGQVIATDLNPEAVRCAQLNALAQHLERRIETRTGDLFAPVRGEKFDLILFNPPFYHGQPRDLADQAWRSPDTFERFLAELPAHLTPQGRALVVLSSDGDITEALESAPGLSVRVVRQRDFLNEIVTVYEIHSA